MHCTPFNEKQPTIVWATSSNSKFTQFERLIMQLTTESCERTEFLLLLSFHKKLKSRTGTYLNRLVTYSGFNFMLT